MKLYFASNNDHKRKEVERLLPGYSIMLPKDEGIEFNPDETGSTYIDNALIKARTLYEKVKAPVIADDSGLEVRALSWAPGVHTARYGEQNGILLSSYEKNKLLLKNMENFKDRYAVFISSVVLYLDRERIYIIQEKAEGEIVDHISSGTSGFGYDPIFYNKEARSIVSELPEGDKDKYSHRGKAMRKIKLLLEKEFK